MTAHILHKWLACLGACNVVCFATYTLLSYGLAPVAAFGRERPRETAAFDRLAQALQDLGPQVQGFVRGHSMLAQERMWLLAYCLPILLSTGIFLVMLLLVARQRHALTPDMPQRLFRWALGFALASCLAAPVLVADFWLSLAWGRMVATGLNPYHADLTMTLAGDLPVEQPLWSRMTYGPLWALISGMLMWFGQHSVVLAAGLFKALLTGAWMTSLWLVWRLLHKQSVWHQCVGLLIFGWLPLSVLQIVADGHNDISMVVLLLLWLYGLEQRKGAVTSVALAASALMKYVTVGFFILEFLHVRGLQRRSLQAYLPQFCLAVLIMSATLGVFFRSPDFFDSVTRMRNWDLFSPQQAVTAVSELIGIKLYPLTAAALAFFPLLALYETALYWRHPTPEAFRKAALAGMCAIIFSAVGHVWPWFLLWALGLAAVVPHVALTRWVVGVALGAPFVFLPRTLYTDETFPMLLLPTLLLYIVAILWWIFVPRQWLGACDSRYERA